MTRVIVNGFGAIGQKIARQLLNKQGVECVGVTTARQQDWGKDVGELLGLDAVGVKVRRSLLELLRVTKADAVFDATRSFVQDIREYVLASVRAGADFISTCEELAYPWREHPTLAQEFDELAKSHSVTVLGTGINPGFIGDWLPLVFSAPCREVRRITSVRTTNAVGLGASALEPFAIGKPLDEFQRRLAADSLKGFTGHREEIAEVAAALGWKISRIDRVIEPRTSGIDREGPFFRIPRGTVCGVRTKTSGYEETGEELITLTLNVTFQPTAEAVKEDVELGIKTGDFLTIDGDPRLELELRGLSDAASVTANHAVNALPYVLVARPGLLSPKDFPPFVPRP
ncbi:MAG: hypothetical protein HY900_10660 [Deltaproteobacteria bacterium]|nr:hypothetical protein [Deltaproteobacteria bacterium]